MAFLRRIRRKSREKGEAETIAEVRQSDVERDGYCRILRDGATELLGECDGYSELAHLGESRRFKTRGLAPDERHTTKGTAMLCSKHHRGPRGYDAHGFEIEFLSDDGADGRIRYVKDKEFFDARR